MLGPPSLHELAEYAGYFTIILLFLIAECSSICKTWNNALVYQVRPWM